MYHLNLAKKFKFLKSIVYYLMLAITLLLLLPVTSMYSFVFARQCHCSQMQFSCIVQHHAECKPLVFRYSVCFRFMLCCTWLPSDVKYVIAAM